MEKVVLYSDFLLESLNRLMLNQFLAIEDITYLANDFQRFKTLINESKEISEDLKEKTREIIFSNKDLKKELFKKSIKMMILSEIPLIKIIFASKIGRYEDEFVRNKIDLFRVEMNSLNLKLKQI